MSEIDSRNKRFEERDQELIRIAELVIAEHGVHGLSIDKIAARFDYSRPTIYQHFGNKADVVCAVATEVLRRQWRASEYAIARAQNSRERIAAVVVAFSAVSRYCPSLTALSVILHDRVMIEQVGEKRLERLTSLRRDGYERASEIVLEAMEAGDLPRHEDVASVILPVWAFMVGSSAAFADSLSDWRERTDDLVLSFYRGLQALLNGVGWQPIQTPEVALAAKAKIAGWVNEQIEADFEECLRVVG